MSCHDWPWKNYPPNFLGPAVLFPGIVIVPLLAAFQTTPMMPSDDIYYTGISVRKKLASNFILHLLIQPGEIELLII